MTRYEVGDRTQPRVFEYEGRFYMRPSPRGCGVILLDGTRDEELCDAVYDILRFGFDGRTEGFGRIRVRIEVESMDD